MRSISLVIAGLVAVGCAPADVAGNYTISTTNQENQCGFSGWTDGETQSGVPVVVTQDGGVVQLDVGGGTGLALDVVLGSSMFNGEVGGSHVSADLIGSASGRQGSCAYTVTVELDGDLSGDTLTGRLVWRPVTNHHADCGILETCENVQLFNGTRPPTGG